MNATQFHLNKIFYPSEIQTTREQSLMGNKHGITKRDKTLKDESASRPSAQH